MISFFSFHWFEIFLVLWFALSMSMAWMKEYKHTIMANVAGCLSFVVYASMAGEYVAAAVPFIAACTSLLQLALPASKNPRIVFIRNAVAISSAVIACTLFYQKPIDILPCLGFTIIRLGEAQQSANMMKFGFVSGATLWTAFGVMAGLHLLVVLEVILIATFLYKFWSESQAAKIKAFPEP